MKYKVLADRENVWTRNRGSFKDFCLRLIRNKIWEADYYDLFDHTLVHEVWYHSYIKCTYKLTDILRCRIASLVVTRSMRFILSCALATKGKAEAITGTGFTNLENREAAEQMLVRLRFLKSCRRGALTRPDSYAFFALGKSVRKSNFGPKADLVSRCMDVARKADENIE